MTSNISIITVPFLFGITVNCYLVRAEDGFALIDTGMPRSRSVIEGALERAGCQPGDLKLIALTHGDWDHCGNAAYLGQKYGAKITIHEADRGMVEQGDMFWNRKPPHVIVRALMNLLLRLPEADRFRPDFYIAEGDTLRTYGLDAQVVELPGHSSGSVGLMLADGSLFCGDLLANTRKPGLWSIIDDAAAAQASLEKVKRLPVTTIYPGHGKPFTLAQLQQG